MSMRSSFDRGYGFTIEGCDDLTVLKAVANHEETLKKILGKDVGIFSRLATEFADDDDFAFADIDGEDLEEIEDLLDGSPIDISFDSDTQAFYLALYTEIIGKETDVFVVFSEGQEDVGSYPAIMLPYMAPWFYGKKERNMSEDEFVRAMIPYTDELNIPKEEIGEVEVEYYG